MTKFQTIILRLLIISFLSILVVFIGTNSASIDRLFFDNGREVSNNQALTERAFLIDPGQLIERFQSAQQYQLSSLLRITITLIMPFEVMHNRKTIN